MEITALSLFTLIGVLISYHDFKNRRIPNILVIILLSVGVFFVIVQGCDFWTPFWCMLGLAGSSLAIRIIYQVSANKEALGMGDIKLLGALGWWVQPLEIPTFLFFAGLTGAIIGGLWILFKKEKFFPFGPAIFIGYLIFRLLKLDSSGNSGILCTSMIEQ